MSVGCDLCVCWMAFKFWFLSPLLNVSLMCFSVDSKLYWFDRLSLSLSCMKCVSFFEIANAPISVVWPGHLRNQPSKTYRNHKTNAYPVPRNMCQRETIEKCTRTENWHIQKHIDKFHRFVGNSTTARKDQTWNVVVRRTKRANIYESFKSPVNCSDAEQCTHVVSLKYFNRIFWKNI